jgi:hypothetical protein
MAKRLSTEPFIDPTAEVVASRLGAFTEVGARTKLLEVELPDYSYVVNDSEAPTSRANRTKPTSSPGAARIRSISATTSGSAMARSCCRDAASATAP